MNEFTKDELGQIKQCVYFEGWKSEGENSNQDLLDKIQAMIDNYCDHKRGTRAIYDSGLEACRDCGEIL